MLDPNRHPGRVDVRDAQVEHFVEAQAGRVGRLNHRAMFQIRRVGDHLLHVLRLKIAGSRPGWRIDGIENVVRSRFKVVW